MFVWQTNTSLVALDKGTQNKSVKLCNSFKILIAVLLNLILNVVIMPSDCNTNK